jgi:hypothetical protein
MFDDFRHFHIDGEAVQGCHQLMKPPRYPWATQKLAAELGKPNRQKTGPVARGNLPQTLVLVMSKDLSKPIFPSNDWSSQKKSRKM